MSRIRSKDTGPELAVRRLVHGMGFRFRLHRRDLPGTPDLVFPSRRKAIFVHGCFWHGHQCGRGRMPTTNQEYWVPKIAATKRRDGNSRRLLRIGGWASLVVWECEIRNTEKLAKRIGHFLGRLG